MLEARVDRLETALVRLAEAQERTDERFAQLADAQRQTEARPDRLAEGVDQLAEAQRRTELRVEELAEAQRRTEARVDLLAARLDQLTERVDLLAARLDQLTERVDQLAEQVSRLVLVVERQGARLDRMDTRLGDVRGRLLEMTYRDRAPAYFDPLLRRIHALTSEELAAVLDKAQASGAIEEPERRELLWTDVVVSGRDRDRDTAAFLAVEVSATVDEDDVWRALRRAEMLARATGQPALPVVAGEAITEEAEELSRSRGVQRVLDGRTSTG